MKNYFIIWYVLFIFFFSLSAFASEGQLLPGSDKIEVHHIADQTGRAITYYITRATTAKPIALVIQGSGCGLVYEPVGDTGFIGRSLLVATLIDDGRFRVLQVEKPYAVVSQRGDAEECPAAFNADYSAESWYRALDAALKDAQGLPMVDPHRLFVLGQSEGADLAALVAGRHPDVTDVMIQSGGGPTQLFDFFAFPYVFGKEMGYDQADFPDLEADLRKILADPDNHTTMIWGHPYKRWASFFALSPVGALLQSTARVYCLHGVDDRATPIISMEVTAASLLGRNRDVEFRRVPGAGHSLQAPGRDGANPAAEYRRAIDWFWRK